MLQHKNPCASRCAIFLLNSLFLYFNLLLLFVFYMCVCSRLLSLLFGIVVAIAVAVSVFVGVESVPMNDL